MANLSLFGATGFSMNPSLGASLPVESQLPRLTQETELQKLLADERMRSEQHRTNYQQLKAEHTRLQEEYLALQEEVKATIEESRVVQEKYRSMYETCHRELIERQTQLDDLRSKVFTPQKLEAVRFQIHEDLERAFREKYIKQEAEVEDARTVVNKLRYELSFLKSEYEHDKAEHARQQQELQMQHQMEVSNLRKERDATLSKVQAESSSDSSKVRTLQRDNATLHVRLKGLLSEIEELRADKDKQAHESDSIQRSQAKQLGELQSTVRALEVERESLKRQTETFQHDSVSHGTEQAKLRSRIHELERELTLSRGQAEESAHRAQVQLSDLKLDLVRQRGDLEKDRDRLANLVEDLRTQLDIAEHKVKQMQTALEEKEREAVQRVNAAREEEFVKIAKAENEKFELETKIQEMERRKIDDDARRHADQERLDQRVQTAHAEKEHAEREVIGLRARIQVLDSLQEQLERERSENSELKSKIHQLETQFNASISQEQDMTDKMIRLRNECELAREELRLTQQQLSKLQSNHDVMMAHQRAALNQDRTQIESRISELEQQLSTLHAKYSQASSIHKKLKQKYSRVTGHLRDKIIILRATNEELEMEKKALQKCVPAEQHARLKKQWKELYRRHQEFRNIILGHTPHDMFIGCRSFLKMDPQLDFTIPNMTYMEQELEKQHQEDLRMLRDRLDHLDNLQTAQLEELTTIAHSTLINSQVEQHLDSGDNSLEKHDLEKPTCSLGSLS